MPNPTHKPKAASSSSLTAKSALSKTTKTPIKRDPERTRLKILDAATSEFARHGLGGTRVDRISKRAGSNERMLYYYFGSKEKLFLAVLERAYLSFVAAERALELDLAEPEKAIQTLCCFIWDYYWDHPELVRLLNSENLHQAKHLKRSARLQELLSPLVSHLGDILAEGVKQGLFRADIDAAEAYIKIGSLGYFYISNQHTIAAVLGRDITSVAARRARYASNLEMVLAYLRQH
ncbi:TetR/AcrR family transcriptional regulator [Parvibium lacunae]|uniref:TetR/AcrR family transcriptional regulator n=1 Tax=Parvibium lacunae TaxID=1888893 RepID=A0A368L4D2_9BURK|nr:TetR family transcriptional regulator [Parvibium lacunae]RCS58292.1 TetR/AcrR family transcriptional regulator [Parvibium lacunae]